MISHCLFSLAIIVFAIAVLPSCKHSTEFGHYFTRIVYVSVIEHYPIRSDSNSEIFIMITWNEINDHTPRFQPKF
jgi:hypothetical protein